MPHESCPKGWVTCREAAEPAPADVGDGCVPVWSLSDGRADVDDFPRPRLTAVEAAGDVTASRVTVLLTACVGAIVPHAAACSRT